MHHLILVRESDPETSGSIGCCCRIGLGDVRWDLSGHTFPERWNAATGFGELYRTLRKEFAGRVKLTVIDPRNIVSFIPLVVRDAIRFQVPLGAALQAIGSTSNATGVLDGRVIYWGTAPPPAEVVDLVAARLEIDPVTLA